MPYDILSGFFLFEANIQRFRSPNGDWRVDGADSEIHFENWEANLQNPTQADGDLDLDGDIDIDDLDLVLAQFGMAISVVS